MGSWLLAPLSAAAQTESGQVNITATVPAVCGNGIVQTGEECDGAALNGQSCTTKGFSGGTLSCSSRCTFDTSACAASSGSSSDQGGVVIPFVNKILQIINPPAISVPVSVPAPLLPGVKNAFPGAAAQPPANKPAGKPGVSAATPAAPAVPAALPAIVTIVNRTIGLLKYLINKFIASLGFLRAFWRR